MGSGERGLAMKSATDTQLYQVSGLWCSSCARALQHAMSRLDGVRRASVDFVTHTVELSADSEASIAAARSLAEGMGYKIEPYRDVASLREELVLRTRGELVRLAWVAFFAVWTMALALVEYTEVMGSLSDREFRLLAIAMGALSVTGVFGGAYKVYLIGLTGIVRGKPSIDSLLVVTSLACLALSIFNLANGIRAVYFDSAILAITVVLGIRAVLAHLSRQQLDLIYSSFDTADLNVRVLEDGSESVKPVNAVQPGYRVRIAAGSEIAVDGKVVAGSGAAQSALFTGEAEPVALQEGSQVWAGEILLEGELEVEVDTHHGERQIDRLSKQVLGSFHSADGSGKVDTFLAYAAPGLLLLSLLSLGLQMGLGASFAEALPGALAVIIVACPCALFFCKPLPLIRAQSLARRAGALVLRPQCLLRLAEVRALAFDKTGTLTNRAPEIELLANETSLSEAELWSMLAGAELNVQHPIAYAVQNQAARIGVKPENVRSRRLLPDGVTFEFAGRSWFFGKVKDGGDSDLCLWFRDSKLSVAKFRIRFESRAGFGTLRSALAQRVHLSVFSGDRSDRVEPVVRELEFNSFGAELTPSEKASRVERLQEEFGTVLYCGDGYNDVQALSAADVALCMSHSPAAVRFASDAVLLRSDATPLLVLFEISRRARRRFRQNMAIACGYNAIAIPTAVLGVFAPWVAAAAMGGVTLLVLVNSMR